MMVILKHLILILIFLSFIILNKSVSALSLPGHQVEFTSGLSTASGYYTDYFDNGTVYSLNYLYRASFTSNILLLETGLSYSHWDVINSKNSELKIYSMRGGFILAYPLFNMLQPYAGMFIQGSMINLEMEYLNRSSSEYKYGGGFKAGFYIPLIKGLGLKAGSEYHIMNISDEKFKTFSVTASINYSFPVSYSKNLNTVERPLNNDEMRMLLYARGMEKLKKKNLGDARKCFETILEFIDDKGAKEQLESIHDIEKKYELVSVYIGNNRHYDAIALLIITSRYMDIAEIKLENLRKSLAERIPELEKNGITAYEKQNYEDCIQFMNQIIMIQPDNKVAKIYLPRSIKRKRAVEKLMN